MCFRARGRLEAEWVGLNPTGDTGEARGVRGTGWEQHHVWKYREHCAYQELRLCGSSPEPLSV